jgi:hypothetical protein
MSSVMKSMNYFKLQYYHMRSSAPDRRYVTDQCHSVVSDGTIASAADSHTGALASNADLIALEPHRRREKYVSTGKRGLCPYLTALQIGPARGLWTNSGSFAVKGVLNRRQICFPKKTALQMPHTMPSEIAWCAATPYFPSASFLRTASTSAREIRIHRLSYTYPTPPDVKKRGARAPTATRNLQPGTMGAARFPRRGRPRAVPTGRRSAIPIKAPT